MPSKMTSEKLQTGTQSRMPQSSNNRNDDATTRVPETPRTLKKKNPPANAASGAPSHFRTPSMKNTSDTRTGAAPKRRMSTRERSSTLGSRPFPSNTRSATNARGAPHAPPTNASRSSSKNSNSTFGTSVDSVNNDKHTPSDGGDFITPINFDDFHNSIMSGEPSLNHFPAPGKGVPGHNAKASGTHPTGHWESNRRQREDTMAPVGTTRRQGTEPEQKPAPPDPASAVMPPPPAPGARRARRQSFAPPSSSTTATGRQPRKSLGPGMLMTSNTDPHNANNPVKRKPSISRKTQGSENSSGPTINTDRTSQSSGHGLMQPPYLNTQRTQKTQSLQPPTRSNENNLMAPGSPSDPAGPSPTSGHHTPSKSRLGDAGTPSSQSKRMSVMPAHASGLGARTISPTDARRMKRMSLIPQPPPVPQASPTNADLGVFPRPRSTAQSPSMIPRKSVTPSSSRTTPDPNRKSYSSGLSLSSNTSYNSARNSNGSFQNRMSQNISSSRLPTPKPRHDNAAAADEEDVPPVPAIPKAYESPKAEADSFISTPRKSSLPLEPSNQARVSKEGDSSSDPPSAGPHDVEENSLRPPRNRGNNAQPESRHKPGVSASKKNLQPLKLPPLNLLPLDVPTSTRIDAIRDKDTDVRGPRPPESPPLRNTTQKTPSTPLTASKANFSAYAANDHVPRPMTQTRSNSSIFTPRAISGVYRAEHSSSALDTSTLNSERAHSPYISPTVPKGSGWGDTVPTSPVETRRTAGNKLTGPRPQTQAFPFSPLPDTSKLRHVSYGAGPSGNTALSAKRQTSIELKKEIPPSDTTEKTNENTADQSIMPPPKLPASATWGNLTTARKSPTSNLNYIQTRRRPSASNATSTVAPRRKQSISSDQNHTSTSTPSTESGETESSQGGRAASSLPSAAHKLASGTRSPSNQKGRPQEGELDKDDLTAEEEMRKLGSKRKDFEAASKELAELRRRASPKERATPAQALKVANLNIFERGEIIDFKDIYFCGTHKAKKHVGDLNSQSGNFGYDDERGDYNIVIGDHIAYRYEIVDVLGKGSFGQVVRCVDHKTGQLVAVKIIRNKKRFHQQALVEVNILQKLREWDPDHRHSVVNFTHSFYFRGHLCISTELLGMNLYELIKAYDFKGFSTKIIRRFTKQMLSTLVLLRTRNVVHCDLKPENILLAHPMRAEIKTIDFGSSCFENEKVYTYIQSRFYRSPEVILGMSYGMPIDMWSLGCILAELYTGYPIFPGENEQEQLGCIMEIFGPPEKHLIEKSTRKKLFFDSQGKPRLTVSSKGRRRKPSSKDLRHALKCDDDAFIDFIARCLRWDPARRLTPQEALNHPFITGIKANPRPRPPVTAAGSPGPKRNTSGSISSARPLPDPPPPVTLKPGAPRAGNSPVKGGASRRLSAMPNTETNAAKHVSNAPGSAPSGGSALPRASGRTASGKPDLAAAAAATSLV